MTNELGGIVKGVVMGSFPVYTGNYGKSYCDNLVFELRFEPGVFRIHL
jgi:hypothetical protein